MGYDEVRSNLILLHAKVETKLGIVGKLKL